MATSSRKRFRSDPQLVARMGITMFLIGALYVGVVAALIASGINLVFVIVIAGGLLFAQYYFSDKMALYGMGGHIVTPEEAPELHGIVDRLCALSDMPKPRVAIADTDIPNAFATGRNPKHAVICATTGIMRRLEPQELEGVLSHELSHVAHRDVAVMTFASFLGMVAGFVTRMALYSGFYGGGGYDDDDDNNGVALFFIVLLVSILVYALSFILTRTLSRYRELSADRSGALLTGRPSALASALQKVTGDMSRIPTRDLRAAEPFNAFFFTPALANGVSISSFFSTHPTLEKRLAQLAKISAELGQPV
ncbi:MAG: heat shock protein HtpX [Frankiaceae bacterium]|jgi:heat shock protein HtpX|nr:heat shock protein HtpX [Frankiaceae bacterium]MDQ1699965.1 heat shock protein HtpX [Frankiaceae bacterium]